MTTDNLIIDNSNLFWRTIGGSANPNSGMNSEYVEDGNYSLFKSMYIFSLFQLMKEAKPQQRVILALDDKNYWRKKIFPLYKAQRKKERSENKFFKDVNFEELFKVSDEFFKELVTIIPQIQSIKIPNVEADDVIAILTEHISLDTHCISTDKDMYQLYRYKGYKQSKFGNDIQEVLNPMSFLHEKICRGDKSDNIPSIYPRLGIKTYQKMMENGSLLKLISEDSNVGEVYSRNREIVDFKYIPKQITKDILKEYHAFVPERTNEMTLYNFLLKHKMNFILDNHFKTGYNSLKNMWGTCSKSPGIVMGVDMGVPEGDKSVQQVSDGVNQLSFI